MNKPNINALLEIATVDICIPDKAGRRCIMHNNMPLTKIGICYENITPICICKTPVPWLERRFDGNWSDEDGNYEQRTCIRCGATMSREIP